MTDRNPAQEGINAARADADRERRAADFKADVTYMSTETATMVKRAFYQISDGISRLEEALDIAADEACEAGHGEQTDDEVALVKRLQTLLDESVIGVVM